MRAAAAGVVGLDDRLQPTSRWIEKFHEWYSGLRLLRARIVPAPRPRKVLSPCELPGGSSMPVGIRVVQRRVARGVGVQRTVGVELTLNPPPVWPKTVARLNVVEEAVAGADGRLVVDGVSEAETRLQVVHVARRTASGCRHPTNLITPLSVVAGHLNRRLRLEIPIAHAVHESPSAARRSRSGSRGSRSACGVIFQSSWVKKPQ